MPENFQKPLVISLGLVALACILLSFFNQWLLFGILTWLLMALGLAIGFGRESARKRILVTIVAIFLLYSVLLLAMAAADKPEGEVELFLGFPLATAILVYGIWPAGALAGALYALVFDSAVLPEEKLEKFLRDFGSGSSRS